MAKITTEETRKLARLCRLRLSENEITDIKKDLTDILNYVEVLQKVDISDLEPTSQVTGLSNVVRTDEIVDYQTSADDLLKNAPDSKDHLFKVKRIL